MIYAFFLFVFVQKSFLTKNFFLYVEINLTTRVPLYTCLVFNQKRFFAQKVLTDKVAAMNLTTLGPLYTYLVFQ